MNITILATRIAGKDGVSLETEHWRIILRSMGHNVQFVAGELDRSGIVMPELHFQHRKTAKLYQEVVYGKNNYERVEAEIFSQAGVLEGKLRDIFRNQKMDLLIVPNVLSLPMHFPLAVALSRVIEDKKINTIARHHDFWWERDRFNNSTLFPFFEKYFPPLLNNIKHVVINSASQEEFIKRTGIVPTIIWDTADFSKVNHRLDSFSKQFRKDFGLKDDDIVFLQATRIVPRKRIELAIELVEKLNNPKAVLVIAGSSGDEGRDYEVYLRKLARKSKARVKFIGKYVNSHRRIIERIKVNDKRYQRNIYTLWDCYRNCDIVTYPTILEGFGNQFIEAVLYKKPILVSPYEVYKRDIKPLGFNTLEIPEKINNTFIKEIQGLMSNNDSIEKMVEENFRLGEKYLSYDWTKKQLKEIL